MTYQDLYERDNAVLREKYIALNAYIKERPKKKWLNFYQRKLKWKETKFKESKRMNIINIKQKSMQL